MQRVLLAALGVACCALLAMDVALAERVAHVGALVDALEHRVREDDGRLHELEQKIRPVLFTVAPLGPGGIPNCWQNAGTSYCGAIAAIGS